MSKLLSELLDEPQVLVESAINKLENWSGWQSTDVRLLAQVNNKVRLATAQLGLDPDDTTGPELYHALSNKLHQDESKLTLSHDQIAARLAKIYRVHKVYALKRSAAKDLLRSNPPKHTMKQLRYRSVDSMLKRENVSELFAVLPMLETPTWMNGFWKKLSRLHPSDFEPQKVEVIVMPASRWDFLKNKANVSANPLLGIINIWSLADGKLALCADVAQNVEQLRATCAYIRLKQVEANFGKKLVDILRYGMADPLEISRLGVTWQTIFRHFGKRSRAEHTEFFGPHLLHEDIATVQSLIQVSPLFRWWEDLAHVLASTKEGLVSLNLADTIDSVGQPFAKRSLSSARHSIWHELIHKYMQSSGVEQHLLAPLERQTLSFDTLPARQAENNEIQQLLEAIA